MNSYVYIAFLMTILSRTNDADRIKSQQRQEDGMRECESYGAGKYPAGVWEDTWKEPCKLDSHNRTIKEKGLSRRTNKNLYDPCCTDYMGMVCRPSYRGKGIGYCGKPDPYQEDRGFGRDDFLSLMKKNKMAEGIQLDDRWRDVD